MPWSCTSNSPYVLGSQNRIACGAKRPKPLVRQFHHRYRLPATNRTLRLALRLQICCDHLQFYRLHRPRPRQTTDSCHCMVWRSLRALWDRGIFGRPNAHPLVRKISLLGCADGDINNRNTAAVYFGSCAILWLLLVLQKIRHRLPSGPIYWRNVPPMFLTRPICCHLGCCFSALLQC